MWLQPLSGCWGGLKEHPTPQGALLWFLLSPLLPETLARPSRVLAVPPGRGIGARSCVCSRLGMVRCVRVPVAISILLPPCPTLQSSSTFVRELQVHVGFVFFESCNSREVRTEDCWILAGSGCSRRRGPEAGAALEPLVEL